MERVWVEWNGVVHIRLHSTIVRSRGGAYISPAFSHKHAYEQKILTAGIRRAWVELNGVVHIGLHSTIVCFVRPTCKHRSYGQGGSCQKRRRRGEAAGDADSADPQVTHSRRTANACTKARTPATGRHPVASVPPAPRRPKRGAPRSCHPWGGR